MDFVKFRELFQTLKTQMAVRNEFLDKLPKSIQDAFFDNELVESLYVENNALMRALFGDSIWDDIQYFLFEDVSPWQIKITNGKEYLLYTEEDIMNYFEEVYTWKDCD